MTTKREGLAGLQTVPIFSSLSQDELEKVFDLARVVRYEGGRSIVNQGETGFGFHLILSGDAKVVRDDNTVATLGPGDFFGEMSFIDEQPRSASVVAESELESLVLGGWEFKPLLKNNPDLAWKLLVHLTGRLRDEQTSVDAATC